MKLSRKERDMAVALLVDPLPLPVRGALFTDPSFCAQLELDPKFWFPLDSETSVETGSLNDALRAAIAGRKTAVLRLRDKKTIRAKLSHKGGEARLLLGKKGFQFLDADLLSRDKSARSKALARVFRIRPLTQDEEDKWLAIGTERAFTNREYVDLMTDLGATPEAVTKEFQKPKNLNSDDFLPDSPGYFARLTAPLGSAATLDAFIQGPLAEARASLFRRSPLVALRRIAYGALWQPLIPFDLLRSLEASDVILLLGADDPFSLLCGFELCCSQLATSEKFVALGEEFLKKLVIDEQASADRCNLFAACTFVSVANVRRSAKSSTAPVFWARLAALTHAGVLTNALTGLKDTMGFLRWSAENFFPSYLWSSAIDLREAPRWNPEWIDPNFLYAELVGRIQGAIQLVPEKDRPPRWLAALDIALTNLKDSGRLLVATFPGPFDDFRDMGMMSSDIPILKEVEKKLKAASKLSDEPALFALANASRPSAAVGTEVRRLLAGPVDEPIADKDRLRHLRLAARIAGATRDEAIADAVINHCLYAARQLSPSEALTDFFEAMIEACAAYPDADQHRKKVGDAATRLCYVTNEATDLRNLLAIFDALAIRDNKLAPVLAKARAVARPKRTGLRS